jgi:hypothetical protein
VHVNFERAADGTLTREDGKVYPGARDMLRQLSETADGVVACPLNRQLLPESASSA